MATLAAPPPGTYQPGSYNVGRARIVSVCPIKLEKTERHGPIGTGKSFTHYVLEAAPRDGYVVLDLEDAQEWLMNWESQSMAAAPVPVRVVADSLVRTWAMDTVGSANGKLGIAVVDESRPLEDQVAELQAIQTRFFDGLIDDAQTMHVRHEDKNISDLHRAAARWRNVKVDWVLDRKPNVATKACPNCQEEIIATALGCKHCGANLPKWYAEFGLNPGDTDPAVAEFMAKVNIGKTDVKVSTQAEAKPQQQPIAPPLKNR